VRSAALGIVLFCLPVPISGCGGTPGSMPTDGAHADLGRADMARRGSCTPGQQQGCACPSGALGMQTCRSNGNGFASCVGCPDDLGAGSDDGGTTLGNKCGDCDGCCDGTTCVPYAQQSNGTCGSRASDCAPCATGNCLFGACVTDTGSCGASCQGCCMGTLCVPYQASACGDNGSTCAVCTPGTVCSGACGDVLDDSAEFKVYVRSLAVKPTRADGKVWDPFAFGSYTNPDPYVCVSTGSGADLKTGCTADNCQDVFSCAPDAATLDGLICQRDYFGSCVAPIYFKGADIKAGRLRFVAYDDDGWYSSGAYDDLIGAQSLPATISMQPSYSLGPFGEATDLQFELQ
jgi:hypothetical protein